MGKLIHWIHNNMGKLSNTSPFVQVLEVQVQDTRTRSGFRCFGTGLINCLKYFLLRTGTSTLDSTKIFSLEAIILVDNVYLKRRFSYGIRN